MSLKLCAPAGVCARHVLPRVPAVPGARRAGAALQPAGVCVALLHGAQSGPEAARAEARGVVRPWPSCSTAPAPPSQSALALITQPRCHRTTGDTMPLRGNMAIYHHLTTLPVAATSSCTSTLCSTVSPSVHPYIANTGADASMKTCNISLTMGLLLPC